MNKNFYITTPIYYPSAKPHMGHAYSSIAADFFARFKRIDGFKVHFLTGTDEHGLKIQRAAENKNIEPQIFCDEISQTFRNLSNTLNLSNTDFIRTTEDRHKKTVQYLWAQLEKNDDIYLSKYSGWYSVSDEAFYSDEEITEKENDAIIVASYGTFSTGINIKNLHNVIFASPSKSRVRNLQSIGRVLRKGNNKVKATLYDIADDISYKSRKNYTLNHLIERIKIYNEENFNYDIVNIPIKN